MRKIIMLFMALLTLVAATPAALAKRSIMELPLFERAVLIIKKFETLHKPKHWYRMLAMGIAYNREIHSAVVANSPKDKPTPSCEKTSVNSYHSTSTWARKTQSYSAHSPTISVPVQ